MAHEPTIFIALLRGINVGGHVKLAMPELRDTATQLGMTHVRSVLQSGNLVFAAEHHDEPGLERIFEAATEKRFGMRIDYFVRSAARWEALLRGNPFAPAAEADPAHLLVMLLKDAPASADAEALQAAVSGPEVIAVRDRSAFVIYPDGIGRSRVTNAWLERRLKTRGTARNWNTVGKLATLAREVAAQTT